MLDVQGHGTEERVMWFGLRVIRSFGSEQRGLPFGVQVHVDLYELCESALRRCEWTVTHGWFIDPAGV